MERVNLPIKMESTIKALGKTANRMDTGLFSARIRKSFTAVNGKMEIWLPNDHSQHENKSLLSNICSYNDIE